MLPSLTISVLLCNYNLPDIRPEDNFSLMFLQYKGAVKAENAPIFSLLKKKKKKENHSYLLGTSSLM